MPISKKLQLIAEAGEITGREVKVSTEVFSDKTLVATAHVLTVQVAANW